MSKLLESNKNINNKILHLETLRDSGLDLKVSFLNLDKLTHILFDPIYHRDIYDIITFGLMILPQPR
jgi:hypothetical protein